jgi:hypothetical protein
MGNLSKKIVCGGLAALIIGASLSAFAASKVTSTKTSVSTTAKTKSTGSAGKIAKNSLKLLESQDIAKVNANIADNKPLAAQIKGFNTSIPAAEAIITKGKIIICSEDLTTLAKYVGSLSKLNKELSTANSTVNPLIKGITITDKTGNAAKITAMFKHILTLQTEQNKYLAGSVSTMQSMLALLNNYNPASGSSGE